MEESTRRSSLGATIVRYAALAVLVAIAVFPFYWMALTALRTPLGVYVQENMLAPRDLTLDNFVFAFKERPTALWLRNSSIIALLSATVAVVIGVLAGYSIVRLSYKGNRTMAKLILFSYLVPASLLFIPMFMLLLAIRLFDTVPGLVLAYQSFNVPFCTWLILGYFRSIPEELEDAARIDGCTRMGVLFRVVLPLAGPGVVTAFIFAFTNSWNELLYAVSLIQSRRIMTLPPGLGRYIEGDVFLWGPLMATALLASVPPIILFMVVQRYVVSGMTLGSVKG